MNSIELFNIVCLVVFYWNVSTAFEKVHQTRVGRQDAAEEPVVTRSRPVLIMAHMVNSRQEVRQALLDGANSLENDLQFDSDGQLTRFFHGFPCDCFRSCDQQENAIQHISYLRQLGTPGDPDYQPKLIAVYLDLKLSDHPLTIMRKAGENLANALMGYYFLQGDSKTQAKLILGIEKIEMVDFLRGFLDTVRGKSADFLLQDIGFDISNSEESLSKIAKFYESVGLSRNIIQGDGISNCFIALRPVHRLRQIIQLRDSDGGYPSKAYYWTVDLKAIFRNVLRMGGDGIITNRLTKMLSVLDEPEFRGKFHLATVNDDVFGRMKGSGSRRTACSKIHNTCWKDCTVDGGWCWTNQTHCVQDSNRCTLDSTCTGQCSRPNGHPVVIGALDALNSLVSQVGKR